MFKDPGKLTERCRLSILTEPSSKMPGNTILRGIFVSELNELAIGLGAGTGRGNSTLREAGEGSGPARLSKNTGRLPRSNTFSEPDGFEDLC